jgi:hypothetical protein
MATSLVSTGVQFPDATIQTTAATSAATTLYAIGTYIVGRPANATRYVGDETIAGSSLYTAGTNVCWQTSPARWYNVPDSTGATTPVLVNTGTWRAMGSCTAQNGYASCLAWVRIS